MSDDISSVRVQSADPPSPLADKTSGGNTSNGVDAEDSCSEERAASLISQVETCKDKGNIEFHKGRVLAKHTAGKNSISEACMFYAEGIQALAKADACLAGLGRRSDPGPTSSGEDAAGVSSNLRKRADTVRPSLYLNLAACNLILSEWTAAIACCTHVLEGCGDAIQAAAALAESPTVGAAAESLLPVRSPDNGNARDGDANDVGAGGGESARCRDVAAKALYRRSSARVGEGDRVAAREDLAHALRLKPGDVNVRRELKKVEKALADEEAKERLRRETEEGKRRLEQKQQQQQNAASTNPATAPRTSEGHEPTPTSTRATPAVAGEDVSNRPSKEFCVAQRADDSCADQGDVGSSRGDKSLGDRAARPDREESGEDEEPFPTWNGGECRDGLYTWNQSVREVQVCVKVPAWARASGIRVDFRRSRLSIAVRRAIGKASSAGAGLEPNLARVEVAQGATTPVGTGWAQEEVVLAGALSRPVQVDECLWTMERPGRVLLYLQKELPADGEPGFEWWATVVKGDAEIDVLKCDAGSDVSKYPDHARRRGAKALWDHQQKSPEERRQEQRMQDARREMEEEAEERQRDLDNALKDPTKAELYRKLREVMPDTSISIK